MATIDIPGDIILPIPETDKEREFYKLLSEYFTEIRKTFIEIEGKLP